MNWLRFLKSAAFLAALAATAMPASASLIYQNNFDGNVASGAGITTTIIDPGQISTAIGAYGGWSGNIYVNDTAGNPAGLTQWTFSGLASHTTISFSAVLGLLDSWDSTDGGGGYSPDYLDVYIDNVLVASLTTNTALGTVQDYQGGTVLVSGPSNTQVDNHSTYYHDVLLDFSNIPFAHSSSTLVLGIQARGAGWQGGTDESWGLDSLNITYDGVPSTVPEPSSLALLALGSLGLGLNSYRRRSSAV